MNLPLMLATSICACVLFFSQKVNAASSFPPANGSPCGSSYPKDVIQGNWNWEKVHPIEFKDYGCQIVEASKGHPVRSGNKSLRFELRDGDCNSSGDFDDCTNDRSRHEIMNMDSVPEGSEYWYKYSIYVPSEVLKVGDSILFLGQFGSANGTDFMNPLMFEDFVSGYGVRQNDEFYNFLFRGVLLSNASFRDRWVDVMIHAKWSSGNDGFMKIYFNGFLSKSLTGANITSNLWTFFRVGIYNAFISDCNCSRMPTQIVYFDDIRQALTRSEVESEYQDNRVVIPPVMLLLEN